MSYTATIEHHSISRARVIDAPTLAGIKRKATKEFTGEFLDYKIVVRMWMAPDRNDGPIVAQRRVGATRWLRVI